jgi:PHD/YefM family antitoxin component YafN of YafNO toxin-antitoxin module
MYDIKYLTNQNGDKTDVVLSFSDYIELMEEINDLKIIAERSNEDLIEHSLVRTMIDNND